MDRKFLLFLNQQQQKGRKGEVFEHAETLEGVCRRFTMQNFLIFYKKFFYAVDKKPITEIHELLKSVDAEELETRNAELIYEAMNRLHNWNVKYKYIEEILENKKQVKDVEFNNEYVEIVSLIKTADVNNLMDFFGEVLQKVYDREEVLVKEYKITNLFQVSKQD